MNPLPDTRPIVIVDEREFRSKLPSMLDAQGFRVVPKTLQVGDYIFSPTICVERKSLPDLKGSLQSGRLFAQIEAMMRVYAHPILLIEFARDEHFSLASVDAADAGPVVSSREVSQHDLQTKVLLVAMHFPALRVVWSRSPQHTAAIFSHVREGHADPPIPASSHPTDAPDSSEYDPRALLETLPGVHHRNVGQIVRGVRSLSELACMSQEKIAALIGPADAALLYGFLHNRTFRANAQEKSAPAQAPAPQKKSWMNRSRSKRRLN